MMSKRLNRTIKFIEQGLQKKYQIFTTILKQGSLNIYHMLCLNLAFNTSYFLKFELQKNVLLLGSNILNTSVNLVIGLTVL